MRRTTSMLLRAVVAAVVGAVMVAVMAGCGQTPDTATSPTSPTEPEEPTVSAPTEPGPDPSTEPGPGREPSLDAMTETAVSDLAGRLGVDPGEIDVLGARRVTWPDGSLGCPQPGHHYSQALVEGFRATLVHGGLAYDYHAGADARPFLCPSKEKPDGGYEFVPPPGFDT